MNKELICKRFQKNIKTYNENARVQEKMADKLISMIEKEIYEDVLEIGCGAGLLTQKLCKKIKYVSYIANDIVPNCEEYIKNINSDINFIGEDIESYINNSNKQYDLIISNASLQWLDDFEAFIKKLISILKPNGKLIFSTFGKENFREIKLISDKSLQYFTKQDIENILKPYSFTIDEEIRVLLFKTPKDVLKHIKHTGVNSIENVQWTKSDLLQFENAYNNFCSGSPTLTYNPIYVKISNSTVG